MSNKIKLKTCPFCGGNASFRCNSNSSSHYCVGFNFTIECDDCEIKLPGTFKVEFSLNDEGDINPLRDERQKAIEVWNRRVNNERTD